MPSYKKTQPCGELGNPWFRSDNALAPTAFRLEILWEKLLESPNACLPHAVGMGKLRITGCRAIVSSMVHARQSMPSETGETG